MTDRPVAGSVTVEVVADLSRLVSGLDEANARARSTGTQVVANLGQIESAERRVGKAVNDEAAAQDRATAARARAAQGAGAVAAAADRAAAQWAKLSAMGAAQEKAVQAQEKLNRQFMAFSAQGAAQARAIGAVQDAQEKSTRATALHAYAWQNLGFQVNDVVTSLASGASPLMVLAQQGGQVYQVLGSARGGVGAALGEVKDRVVSLAGSYGLLAAGLAILGTAAALTARYVEQQHELEKATLGVGRSAGLTAEQLAKIAEENAEAGRISIAQAKELIAIYLSTGKIQAENLGAATRLTKDFAAATRQGIPEAGQELARGLSTLGEGGLDELERRTKAIDENSYNAARRFLAEGDAAKALSTVIESLSRNLAESGRRAESWGGIFATAWRTVSDVASKAGGMFEETYKPTPELIQRQIGTRRTLGLPTGDLERELADVSRGLDEARRKATETAAEAKRITDATAQSAVRAVLPEIASLERINALRDEANKKASAYENGPGGTGALSAGSQEDYRNAKTALEALTKARSDYTYAQDRGGLAAYRQAEITKAETAALQAKAPADRAAAAGDLARAQQIGAVIDRTERYRQINEASNKVLRESQQASADQSRQTTEATRVNNDLADATARGAGSVALLAAQKKIDQQISDGTIDRADRERKVREELESVQAALNKQYAERTRAARDQTSVQQTLNDQVAAGTLASAEAQQRLSSEVELRRLVIERDAASGDAKERLTQRINDLRAATEAQLSATDRARILGMTDNENDRIAVLQREIELRGESVQVRNRELAILQATQALENQRKGASLTPEGREYINRAAMRSDLDTAKAQYEKLAQDISSIVSGIFDDLFTKTNKGSADLLANLSRGLARLGTRQIEQNVLAPLLGGQGKSGADGKQGGFLTSPLGRGLGAAAAGGSIGYSTQSPLMGAIGGGLAGFASAGPVGALIGAGAGLLGGLFGQSEAKKAAKKKIAEQLAEYRRAYEEAKPQIAQLSRTFRGEATGGVTGQIDQAFTQMVAANKTASQGGDQATADRLVREFEQYAFRLRAAFVRTFEGTLADLGQGLGPNGPFASAAASVASLGEALKAFVADAGYLTAEAGARARATAQGAALASLDAPKALSGVQTRLREIAGTSAGLAQVLVDLGMSADQAATAIRERAAGALDALRVSFEDDLTRKTNTASGKDYLNEAADLAKERANLLADAAALGTDATRVESYVTAALQKIVDDGELTGDAFAALSAAFPDLTGRVHAFTQAVDDAAARTAAASRALGYQDRLFAATNDADTPAGQLAAFDRKAAQERQAEAEAGGQALVDLEAAQAAERAGIVRDFAAQAADAERALASRRLGYQDRLFAATTDTTTLAGQLAAFDRKAAQERQAEAEAGGQALADLERAQYAERARIESDYYEQTAATQKQALEQARQAYDTFARGIRSHLDNLRAGPSSPLSPQARLAAAQTQYDAQLRLAQGGDRTALDAITGYADTLLDAAKGFYASSAGFQAIFERVTGQLGALPTQVSPEQFIVNAVTDMRDVLRTAVQANSPGLIAAALNANFNRLDTSVNGLLDYGEFMAGVGPLATKAEQDAAEALFHAIDENGDGMLSAMEVLRTTLKTAIDAGNAQATASALAPQFSTLTATTGGLLSLSQFQSAIGPLATVSEQQAAKAIFASIDTDGDGQISKLELIRAQAGATAANADATRASVDATRGSVDHGNAVLDQQKAVLDAVSASTAQTKAAVDATNAIAGQQKAVLDAVSAFTSQTKAAVEAGNNLTGAVGQYTLATRDNVATGNGILNAINNLSGLQKQQLELLNSQFSVNNPITIGSYQMQNNMVTALNKIVFNTGQTVVAVRSDGKYGDAAYASGGWVSGPGTGTSDSIPALLSNGEFVVTAAAARANARLLEAMNENAGGPTRMMMPVPVAVPMAVPMAAPGTMGGNADVVAAIRMLVDRIGVLEARLVAAEAAGAQFVGEKVEAHHGETKRQRSDQRQASTRPAAAGSRAA